MIEDQESPIRQDTLRGSMSACSISDSGGLLDESSGKKCFSGHNCKPILLGILEPTYQDGGFISM